MIEQTPSLYSDTHWEANVPSTRQLTTAHGTHSPTKVNGPDSFIDARENPNVQCYNPRPKRCPLWATFIARESAGERCASKVLLGLFPRIKPVGDLGGNHLNVVQEHLPGVDDIFG